MPASPLVRREGVVSAAVTARLLDGFDDPSFGREEWNALVRQGDSNVPYMTWEWQRASWTTLGRGELLLIAAERDGEVVAVAPFYADSGMVFFLGSGSASYMDFVGNIDDPVTLDLLLETARDHVPAFVGFRFHCVPETSRTGGLLRAAAERLDMVCYEESRWPAPAVDLAAKGDTVRMMASGHRLLKHDRYFEQRGPLVLRRLSDGASIGPQLDTLFDEHVPASGSTRGKNRFLEPRQRRFVKELTRTAANTGWLRLSMLEWDGRPIACEFGLCYEGTHYSGLFSVARDVFRRSPEHVLLRRALLAALDDGIATYDFGVGDDVDRFVFATHLRHVQTWGLYPPELPKAL